MILIALDHAVAPVGVPVLQTRDAVFSIAEEVGSLTEGVGPDEQCPLLLDEDRDPVGVLHWPGCQLTRWAAALPTFRFAGKVVVVMPGAPAPPCTAPPSPAPPCTAPVMAIALADLLRAREDGAR